MSNPLNLTPGAKYRVVKSFTDYDHLLHPIGEEWIFLRTNFLPYEDGLTLHVRLENTIGETVYRLQWRPVEQAFIIEHFAEYVVAR